MMEKLLTDVKNQTKEKDKTVKKVWLFMLWTYFSVFAFSVLCSSILYENVRESHPDKWAATE